MSTFARTHARADDIDTSHAAATAAKGMSGKHAAIVLAAIKGAAMSSQQIAAATGLEYLQVVRRVSDLRNAGLIADSGRRLHTRSGRMAAVWCLSGSEGAG
jgi:hypothetical protein